MNEHTDDYKEWGYAWVYCNQHLRPHTTGWCTVGIDKKVCLFSIEKSEEQAIEKCKQFGFKLYSEKS